MKKLTILFILCFAVLPICLFAQEEIALETEDSEMFYDEEDIEEDFIAKEKGPFYIKDRTFEVGLLHFNFGFSNDFITFSQLSNNTIVIDLDKLGDGFNMNMNLFFSPIFFNYNRNGEWGFGLSTGLDFEGSIGLGGKMLTFKEAVNEKSDLSAAAFAEVGAPIFFHIQKFKIKIKPAVYYPLLYVEPNISYTYKTTTSGDASETILKMKISPRVYTPMPTEGGGGLSATPGIDFYIGAEYPLSEVLGLKDIHPLLDFDVGLDIYGFPMVPATMSDYTQIFYTIGSNDPFNFDSFNDDSNSDDFFSDEGSVHGKKTRTIFRPYKMLGWAEWRPLGTQLITVIPTLGFAVNPLYVDPASVECGIKGRVNLRNLLITTLGIGHHDRLWKNSLDLTLNLRAVQFDFGLNLQAPAFVESWTGGGIGMGFGLTVGW